MFWRKCNVDRINSKFTENDYIVSFIYLILFFILTRLFISIGKRIILKITLKTKTNLDDLILEKTKHPLTLIIFLFGLKLALEKIPGLQQNIFLIEQIFHSIIILIGAYLIYSLISLSFLRAWIKFSKRTKINYNEALIQLLNGSIKILLIIFTFLSILSIWGIEIGPLLAGLGIGGIAIAFALQSSLSNIFGGISIILDTLTNPIAASCGVYPTRVRDRLVFLNFYLD